MTPILIIGGNAYRLSAGVLQTAAVLVDDRVDTEWADVDWPSFSGDDREQLTRIEVALEAVDGIAGFA